MPDNEATKPYRGYVSAYLKQPPRTLAEAEKDARDHNPDGTASQGPGPNAGGSRSSDGER